MISKLTCFLVATLMVLPPAGALGIFIGEPVAPHNFLPTVKPQPARLPMPATPRPSSGEALRKQRLSPPANNRPEPTKQQSAASKEVTTAIPTRADQKPHQADAKATKPAIVKAKHKRNTATLRTDQRSKFPATTAAPTSTNESKYEDQPSVTNSRQSAGSVKERNLEPHSMSEVQLQSENVSVEIVDHLAKTKIVEVFKNNGNYPVSGTYLFPLPKDVAFSSFTLHINGVPVKGELLEASDARRQYENIVRLLVDPGLLEYVDSRTVRARIFPIPAHGTRKIELEYTQLLKTENGFTRYEFPLKAENGSSPIANVDLKVKINSKETLRTVWSPSHKVSTRTIDPRTREVSFRATNLRPARNFALAYSASNSGMTGDIAFYKPQSDDGYFLLSLNPNLESEPIAKDVLLIADTSGSMKGEKIQQLKAALKYIVGAVSDADRFNIISFNTRVIPFQKELVSATKATRAEANQFIDAIQAAGGTNIERALTTGAKMISDDSHRPLYLLFVTDGLPTVGTIDIEKLMNIIPSANRARVFDIGIGNDVNTRLLDGLAEQHYGKSRYITADDNLEIALTEVYRGIQQPVLTDVKIAYEGMETKEVYPTDVRDVFAGDQSFLLGRFKNAASGRIVLSGQINGHPKTFSFPFTYSPNSQQLYNELPRLWATRRIGALSRQIELLANTYDNPGVQELEKEVLAISQKFGLISPYASYLAKEPEVRLGAARDAVTIDRQVLDSRVDAIRRAKMLVSYSMSTYIAQSTDLKSRVVGDKTFNLSNDGKWIDVDFDARSFPNPETIVMGSDRYMELSKDSELAKCFSLGRQLIVVWKGKCFQIVEPDQPLLKVLRSLPLVITQS